MARSKNFRGSESEDREPHTDGGVGKSESPKSDAEGEVSFLTQLSNYLFGEQKAQCDVAKSGLELIKALVEDIDADYANGRPTLFDNDQWGIDTRFGLPSKDVGTTYLPFDCSSKNLAKSNGSGTHLIQWSREDVGIRCVSSYDTHVFTLSDENGQCKFKPTGEKIYVNDLTQYLNLDKKEEF